MRITKPATAQLIVFRHSGFGFHSSFVIQRLVLVRFMVPMHGIQVVKAFHEPQDASLGNEQVTHFEVHGPNAFEKNERGLSMNRPVRAPGLQDVGRVP